MEWTDEGIVLGARRHGESGAVVDLMTRTRGRHAGLVRGGGTSRLAALLQPGNTLHAVWRARLESQLGLMSVEPLTLRSDALMRTAHGSFGVTYLAALMRLLPERDPHPGLFATLNAILDAFETPEGAGELLARFEVALLGELGFGLDLTRCAATGGNNDLAYVSPKSGRAVSRSAGDPYADKLFVLPTFLIGGILPPSLGDLEAGLRISGYFLESRVMAPRGLQMPEARAGFLSAVRRAMAATAVPGQ
ncbi:DNA repair protein RecO [Azorhizobium oxalatiphilum]|uniref:DNA repair protein RecO n=1 Tax=Azorhizobium oxalatiphilum TaxID=980631 RepID=A0A917FGF8_9HYPH|nr:DNA repair protein RecO [Azorhizobium oxalatiphilum]GGF73432.1 DNA repair protein RecO [Azorhizobium oxalatiphilum]